MKCTLKTLKGDAFPVDVEGSTTILAVKEMAANSESGKAAGWEVAGIKLIFQGRFLARVPGVQTSPGHRRRPSAV